MKRWIAVLVLGGLLGSACTATNVDTEEVLVSAAASLTDAFLELEAEFEAEHPEIDIVINLGGSSALREQILAGAPVDVFASANRRNMRLVSESGLVVGPTSIFATNQLAIAAPVANSANVAGLDDFSKEDLLIGLCSEAVPCGSLAEEVLSNAGLVAAVDTYEPDVRALLTKVESGELDAGIVYQSDLLVVGDRVVGIAIPDGLNMTAEYPIAVLNGGDNPTGGERFVAFVTSEEGMSILAAYGFGAP